VHVGKLAEVALLMLEGGRVEPAKGVLRAVLKVLGRAPASGSVQAVPVPSTCSSK